jgi:hypothetical protein
MGAWPPVAPGPSPALRTPWCLAPACGIVTHPAHRRDPDDGGQLGDGLHLWPPRRTIYSVAREAPTGPWPAGRRWGRSGLQRFSPFLAGGTSVREKRRVMRAQREWVVHLRALFLCHTEAAIENKCSI